MARIAGSARALGEAGDDERLDGAVTVCWPGGGGGRRLVVYGRLYRVVR